MINMQVKQGAKVYGLRAVMRPAWEMYQKLCWMCGIEPVMTDGIREPKAKFSLHEMGYAFDARLRELPSTQARWLVVILQNFLGNDFDVIYYEKTKHIHIEYQRYLDDREEWQIKNTDVKFVS